VPIKIRLHNILVQKTWYRLYRSYQWTY